MKPVVAITMGDATGVGPEIIVKALDDQGVYDACRPLIIGDRGIMERAARIVDKPFAFRAIGDVAEARFEFRTVDVLDLANLPPDLPFAKVDARAGKAAYEYLAKAVALAMSGKVGAIATAPLHKEALNAAGYPFPGHTEILAHLSGTRDYAMMLASDKLRVIHVTTHVALRKACDLINKDRVLRVIQLADQAVRALGIDRPRIAVAGLNPHSGEGGLFGNEEIAEIIPAVEEAKRRGFTVFGPIAPDTVFYRAAVKGEFDIVVVMYHDQGHIPMKVLAFETGVNVTVGLPFIRTSVDHGTAFGKAGKGTADSRSMTEAIYLAARMARGRTTANSH
ncbi:4-hydroxythreonine-4-phosphate dehydrogenase PdxA [Sporolituus thermophilus]|uniref:4-hydroxythreonine-4-phosphate dehydrogenase n=1 Tax=Sporolituus thermophilus DSM 23256 TaxID=1123285 RepID=A0A1G7NI90_9FIRM|nr:4-hydroxythreonine-4-phosphate dehydrogenase PdxA [Sporolituus thermophilus]SDF73641.1 4-hydroxythreonine-4-phosphate dehydrogenase [Sporolituus thermophilus DSM 23256]